MSVSKNSNPSLNPANNDSLAGLLREAILKELQKLGCCLPAKIIAFERESPPRAEVQLQINVLGTNGTQQSRAPIASVPVYQIGGGGYFLSFPLQSGSPGWLVVCDRDISLYLQSGGISMPNTFRLHNYADGFFLPDIMSGYTISDDDQDSAVLQNLDGSVKIALSSDTITFTAPNFIFNGNMEINGELIVQERLIAETDIASGGNITAAGDITPNTPIPP